MHTILFPDYNLLNLILQCNRISDENEKFTTIIQLIFKYYLYDCCEAIYLGGSRVDPVIDTPHDYDYICFAKQGCLSVLIEKLDLLGFHHLPNPCVHPSYTFKALCKSIENVDSIDLIQTECYPYTDINWFSYLEHYVIKIAGKDICPTPDLIKLHRDSFLEDLKHKACDLIKSYNTGELKYPKRWCHILRGIYILLNNSYSVTEEQKREINILHDVAPGWEEIRDKTIQLLETLK